MSNIALWRTWVVKRIFRDILYKLWGWIIHVWGGGYLWQLGVSPLAPCPRPCNPQCIHCLSQMRQRSLMRKWSYNHWRVVESPCMGGISERLYLQKIPTVSPAEPALPHYCCTVCKNTTDSFSTILVIGIGGCVFVCLFVQTITFARPKWYALKVRIMSS